MARSAIGPGVQAGVLHTRIVRRWIVLSCALGCSPAVEEPLGPPRHATDAAPTPALPAEPAPAEPTVSAPAPLPPAESAPCPEDMAFVDVVHCPNGSHRCLRTSRNEPNNLTLCHEFAPGQRCPGDQHKKRFCVDRYEYPNKKGAHPPVMVSAYDAAGLCAEQGKRMCFESEWTAACEGPEHLPFPYGLERSKAHCNIDNPYIHPDIDKVHHSSDAVRGPELTRLDQSVPSGSMETCKSGFGVYDLTGNFDEWVMTDRVRGKGGWAALKGGAWGHVRNACRPVTTSHVPHWSYYFISFRCCKDPDATALAATPDDTPSWQKPDRVPPPHPAGRPLDRGYTPD